MESLDPPEGKRVLRERMRRVRASIPPSERTALAARAEAHLLSLPEVRSARTVMLFYSFGTEIPTSVLIRRLLERGMRVLLPFLAGEGIEAAEIQPGAALEGAGYGPREPGQRVPVDPGDVDVVVTPGLAFDRAGHRLGYGGGHYDRYLARLDPNTLRVGIGFRSQVVEEGVIPAEPTDERVDVLVTDGGAVTCGPPDQLSEH